MVGESPAYLLQRPPPGREEERLDGHYRQNAARRPQAPRPIPRRPAGRPQQLQRHRQHRHKAKEIHHVVAITPGKPVFPRQKEQRRQPGQQQHPPPRAVFVLRLECTRRANDHRHHRHQRHQQAAPRPLRQPFPAQALAISLHHGQRMGEAQPEMPQLLPRGQPPQNNGGAEAAHHPRAQSPMSARHQVARQEEDTEPRDQQNQCLGQRAKRRERDEGRHCDGQAASGFHETEQPPAKESRVDQEVSPGLDIGRQEQEQPQQQAAPHEPQPPSHQAQPRRHRETKCSIHHQPCAGGIRREVEVDEVAQRPIQIDQVRAELQPMLMREIQYRTRGNIPVDTQVVGGGGYDHNRQHHDHGGEQRQSNSTA